MFLNWAEEEKIPEYIPEVSKAYFDQFGIELKAFSVSPDEGTTVTKL